MFLHTFHPSPVLAAFGPLAIHWYGLLLVVGGVAAYLVSRKLFAKAGVALALLDELLFPLIVAGFVGARAYHVVNEWWYYWQRPLEVFAVWRGGLAIHGALIGGLVALVWFIRNNPKVVTGRDLSLQFLYLADLLAPGFALGQAIGRWGNYFNQELYGLPTGVSWGIPIELLKRVAGFEQYNFFHPTFLYESAWLFVVFIILFGLLRYRLRPPQFLGVHWTPVASRPLQIAREGTIERYLPLTRFAQARARRGEAKARRAKGEREGVSPGRVFFLYLILAGLGRFVMEFFRIDAMPLVAGIRLQQLVSALLVVMGMCGWWWINQRLKNPKIVLG